MNWLTVIWLTGARARARACVCVCVCVCVCYNMEKSARQMASTATDRYFKWVAASTTQRKISIEQREPHATIMCVCVRVCVCVSQWKKVPDEWQARQATPAILQVSSSKHNAKKITTRERGPFHQSITAILTEEKGEEKQFTKPAHVAVYLFRDQDRDRSRL